MPSRMDPGTAERGGSDREPGVVGAGGGRSAAGEEDDVGTQAAGESPDVQLRDWSPEDVAAHVEAHTGERIMRDCALRVPVCTCRSRG